MITLIQTVQTQRKELGDVAQCESRVDAGVQLGALQGSWLSARNTTLIYGDFD